MATSTNLHLTGISSQSPQGYQLPNLDWSDKWSRVGGSANNTILADTTSPYDAQTRIRVATTSVADVYRGTGIDPSYTLPTKRGVSALVQLNLIATVTDSSDSTFRVDLPISMHAVLRVPLCSYLSAPALESVFQYCIGAFYGTNEGTSYADRVPLFNRLVGGITTPPGL